MTAQLGKKSAPDRRQILLYFTVIFLVVMTVLTTLIYILLTNSSNTRLREHMADAKSKVEIESKVLENQFNAIRSDLLFLPELNEILHYKELETPADLRYIENEFLQFIKNKKIYDQLRYLDRHGMELVRVNYHYDSPEIVTTSRLQNKGNRYYFTETLKKPRGTVYISPFDLNLERGKIEIPRKPMIRFGTPIYDEENNPQGIIILNYLGNSIIQYLEDATASYPGIFSLLNADSYWLYAANPDKEWGFMFPEKQNLSLKQQHPELWKRICCQKSYQGMIGETLYTSQQLTLLNNTESPNNKIYILNFISSQEMGIDKHRTRKMIINLIFGVAIIVGLLSWLLAWTITQRNRYRQQLERSALYDNLTGLPNRLLLMEHGKQIVRQAYRYEYYCAVFFIDLDGFKNVNDKLGHEAGDKILAHVANVLQNNIRSSDIAARLGGDEFVIILSRITGKENCSTVAEKIIEEISKEVKIDSNSVQVGASIGIIFIESKEDRPIEKLLKIADEAMYSVKQSGKNNYKIVTDQKP